MEQLIDDQGPGEGTRARRGIGWGALAGGAPPRPAACGRTACLRWGRRHRARKGRQTEREGWQVGPVASR